MKKIIIALVIVLLIPINVYSDDNKILIVRGNGYYPPNEMEIDGQLSGIHKEILDMVSKRLDIQIQFKSVPWVRAVYMVKNGTADAITYMSKTDEREEFAIFRDGNVLSHTENGFFVLKSERERFKFSGDLKAMEGFSIGMIKGFSYGEAFDQADFLFKEMGAATEKQIILKTIAKRIDAGIGNISRIKYIAKQIQKSDKITTLKPYLGRKPVYIAFSRIKGHEELAERFAREIESIKASSEYKELLEKYGQ